MAAPVPAVMLFLQGLSRFNPTEEAQGPADPREATVKNSFLRPKKREESNSRDGK